MERAIAQNENVEKESICITYRGVTQKIPTKDILYLESENHRCRDIKYHVGQIMTKFFIHHITFHLLMKMESEQAAE